MTSGYWMEELRHGAIVFSFFHMVKMHIFFPSLLMSKKGTPFSEIWHLKKHTDISDESRKGRWTSHTHFLQNSSANLALLPI